jgi:hypothetical protein
MLNRVGRLDKIEREHPLYDIKVEEALLEGLADSGNKVLSSKEEIREWLENLSTEEDEIESIDQ